MSLKSGYTTGVYATAALCGALLKQIKNETPNQISIKLPDGSETIIDVFYFEQGCVAQKGENDDIDVTKGCEISAIIADSKERLPINAISHTPYSIGNLQVFAGSGVGVVTKKGLKPPVGYPAINPVPLEMMADVVQGFKIQKPLFVTICVKDGERIAKETANAKVGVLGGISILGTTGIVKPISNEAMLDSIDAELSVAKMSGFEKIIFTLGNTAYKEALKSNECETNIIEIGNFIYDSLQLFKKYGFEELLFIAGIGKMAKVAQGFKNTHNRYGETDFKLLGEWLDMDISECGTVKGVMELLDNNAQEAFKDLLKERAKSVLEAFLDDNKTKISVEISGA